MPIYEYQCEACKHKFEQLQKVSEPLLEVCPECKGKTLRKLVSAAGFRLKGTGWYVTDFKDKKPAGNKDGADTGKAEEGKKTADKESKSSTTSKDSGNSSTKTSSSGSSGKSSD